MQFNDQFCVAHKMLRWMVFSFCGNTIPFHVCVCARASERSFVALGNKTEKQMAFALSVLNVFLANVQSLHSLYQKKWISSNILVQRSKEENGIVKMVFGVFAFCYAFCHSLLRFLTNTFASYENNKAKTHECTVIEIIVDEFLILLIFFSFKSSLNFR